MYWYRFFLEMSIGTILFGILGAAFYFAAPDNIEKLEKAVRNRTAGLLLALPALAACVPHAQIVAPGILQEPIVLWSLALIIPVLCYFYIDYYTARAGAGAVIILAYDLIHYSYDEKLPLAMVLTVMAWLFGFAAIWVSGKPHALRDWFRLAARNRKFAVAAAAAALLSGSSFVIAAIGGILK